MSNGSGSFDNSSLHERHAINPRGNRVLHAYYHNITHLQNAGDGGRGGGGNSAEREENSFSPSPILAREGENSMLTTLGGVEMKA